MDSKHVVSLELSEKLKKNGYPQEGEFWWFYDKFQHKWLLKIYPAHARRTGTFVAPLASELMERLPPAIYIDTSNFWFYVHKNHDGSWDALYDAKYKVIRFSDKNLCNALAKMYIYLAENKLLEGEKNG